MDTYRTLKSIEQRRETTRSLATAEKQRVSYTHTCLSRLANSWLNSLNTAAAVEWARTVILPNTGYNVMLCARVV